jgi:hypothetical protein
MTSPQQPYTLTWDWSPGRTGPRSRRVSVSNADSAPASVSSSAARKAGAPGHQARLAADRGGRLSAVQRVVEGTHQRVRAQLAGQVEQGALRPQDRNVLLMDDVGRAQRQLPGVQGRRTAAPTRHRDVVDVRLEAARRRIVVVDQREAPEPGGGAPNGNSPPGPAAGQDRPRRSLERAGDDAAIDVGPATQAMPLAPRHPAQDLVLGQAGPPRVLPRPHSRRTGAEALFRGHASQSGRRRRAGRGPRPRLWTGRQVRSSGCRCTRLARRRGVPVRRRSHDRRVGAGRPGGT